MDDAGLVLLTGRNGAGKSTFLLCLLGRYPVDGGYIRFNGEDVTGLPVEKRRAAFVNQSSFFGHMDVGTHIHWGSGGMNSSDAKAGRVTEGLGIGFSGKVDRLSQGQKMRVAVATAVLSSPRVILIDEALSNISDRLAVLSELKKMSEEYRFDIVCVSQDAEDSRIADHHYTIDKGAMSRVF